jgi:hypothetical protein
MEELLEKHQKFNELMDKTPDELHAMGLKFTQDHYGYLGISAVTYNKWRKQWEREHLTPESEVDEILDALRNMALGKSRPNMAQIRSLELLLKRHSELTEKKETKFELSISDRLRIANEVVNGLREQCKGDNRICPLCYQSILLRPTLRQVAEPEHEEDRTVATLALPS